MITPIRILSVFNLLWNGHSHWPLICQSDPPLFSISSVRTDFGIIWSFWRPFWILHSGHLQRIVSSGCIFAKLRVPEYSTRCSGNLFWWRYIEARERQTGLGRIPLFPFCSISSRIPKSLHIRRIVVNSSLVPMSGFFAIWFRISVSAEIVTPSNLPKSPIELLFMSRYIKAFFGESTLA